MIDNVCDLDNCLGCSLCEAICPNKAISIKIVKGFYRPVVSEKCIDCHKCQNVCPVNNEKDICNLLHSKPEIAYAAWNNNETEHFKSSSGGIATLISKKIIENEGFVVGTNFNVKTQTVEHKIFMNESELNLARGSKYVHSKKSLIYEKVADLLNEKQGVFIGVPCEVYAMKSYLDKIKKTKYDLYYIDLLCRGGASPYCFGEHLKKIIKIGNITNIAFRGGKYDCRLSCYKNEKIIYQDYQYNDVYFNLFMRHTLYQKACFNCFYAGHKRTGDLTLGDFWGLNKDILEKAKSQGVNLILVNSLNGSKILDLIRNDISLYQRDIQEAIAGNSTLQNPTYKEEEYDLFWEEINHKGFYKAVTSVYGYKYNKRIIKSKVKLIIKKLLGRI